MSKEEFKFPWDMVPKWAHYAGWYVGSTWKVSSGPMRFKRNAGWITTNPFSQTSILDNLNPFPGYAKDSLQVRPQLKPEPCVEYTVRIPWSQVPEIYDWIGVCSNGASIASMNEPCPGSWGQVLLSSVPNWKELKFQRPKPEPKQPIRMTRAELIAEVERLRGSDNE